MLEALAERPEILIPFGIFGPIAITALLITGMIVWRMHQKTKLEIELKLEMLSRGMSADDIERVLAAKVSSRESQADTADYARL